jgi:uncharacterized protein YodC (DUF2158 family)
MSTVPKKFQVGDTVVLNSGGPKMTVIGISPDGGRVWCEWASTKDESFDPTAMHHLPEPPVGTADASFPAACLRRPDLPTAAASE